MARRKSIDYSKLEEVSVSVDVEHGLLRPLPMVDGDPDEDGLSFRVEGAGEPFTLAMMGRFDLSLSMRF